jgi:hypothetical protein
MGPKRRNMCGGPAEFSSADRRAIALQMSSSLGDSVRDAQPAEAFHGSEAHCRVFKRLRISITSAARLGHRSCHAVWGCAGSGKSKMLSMLADTVRRVPGMFVVMLDGGVLQGDDDGLRVFVRELKTFLQSSAAAAFVANHRGSIPAQLADLCDPEDSPSDPETDGVGHVQMPRSHSLPHQALAVLQATLVAMNRGGVSMAVLVDRASRFATWCDRLMYILSGLMHEVDERVGGMSLVLTSLCADMRGIEKRLSSRLTCEMCFLPPLQPLLPDVVAAAARRASGIFTETADRARAALEKLGAPRKRSREQQAQWTQRVEEVRQQAAEADRLAKLVPHAETLLLKEMIGADSGARLAAEGANLDEIKSTVLQGLVALGSEADARELTPTGISIMTPLNILGDSGIFISGGYCSRESFLLLVYTALQAERENGRTFDDLVADISTSLGTQSSAHVDPFALQLALRQLQSWSILEVQRRTGHVVLRLALAAVREFILSVLASAPLCESCGVDTKERHSLSQLFR